MISIRNACFAVVMAAFAGPLLVPAAARSESAPVLVGLDGEFGLPHSTSAQSIEKGIRIALHEINAAGGVLGGRPLKLVSKDNRSMPARGIQNVKDFAKIKDLVAIFSGRFSPVVIETIDTPHALKMINLAVWSSGDPVVNHGHEPNYVFRLSLRDSLAMPKMLGHARKKGVKKVGLLLTNTSWGRSNLNAATAYLSKVSLPISVGIAWYNWRDQTLIAHYNRLRKLGAEAIVLVANDAEGATLVREVAALPKDQRIPILSHWGVTGGDFVGQAGRALFDVDFSIIQTVNLYRMNKAKVAKFLKLAGKLVGISKIEQIEAPVGMAHAYDLMHILAKAIDKAGSTDREKIRDALERVENHDGLIKFYKRPFTPERHEALTKDELLMARYAKSGALVPTE